MELPFEQYEKIQDYLDGNMTDMQRQIFEAELGNNESLQQHVQFEKDLRKNAFLLDELSESTPQTDSRFDNPVFIKNLVQIAAEEYDQEQKSKVVNFNSSDYTKAEPATTSVVKLSDKNILFIAASVLGIMMIYVFLLSPNTPLPPPVAHNKIDTSVKHTPNNNNIANNTNNGEKNVCSLVR